MNYKIRLAFALILAPLAALSATASDASQVSFSSKLTYNAAKPVAPYDAAANFAEAASDAENVGGDTAYTRANRDFSTDATAYVAPGHPAQGQSFTTGTAKFGYELRSVTVKVVGYPNAKPVDAADTTRWNLGPSNGPITIQIGELSGTEFQIRSSQHATAIGEGSPATGRSDGSPGVGQSSSGPGTFMTYALAFHVHLKPSTIYAFDLGIGNGSENSFELAGTNADACSGGTAYSRSGGTVTPLTGDRVFVADIVPATAPFAFAHPGGLHTQADFDRMKAKVAANAEPWKASWDALMASPFAQLGWPAHPVETVIRGSAGNNYTRSQEDAAAVYQLALRYEISGEKAYADKAVDILNAWGKTLKGVGGDSNTFLGSGIVGFQFACAAEMLSAYPGWEAADKARFQDMMLRVFYTANDDFLTRHNDTSWREGGNTHYRLNWDTCNMASMLAIGVLCDNRAVYQQAIDYFKNGIGNGRIDRAAWYMFLDGEAQTEEMGRDQGHDIGGWDMMARFCQVAWNQGDDLYSYDNNRVLRGLEYVAKYNLNNDVPYVPHRTTPMPYTEAVPSGAQRGKMLPLYEMVYNHYVNEKGIAAPYSKLAAEKGRPDLGPDTKIHPSQVDWFGFGSLTFSRDPIAKGTPPSGLTAQLAKGQITLSWWGSAKATGYVVKRAQKSRGPYRVVGTTGETETSFVDTKATDGAICYYVVASKYGADVGTNSAEIAVAPRLVVRYAFDGNVTDSVSGTAAVATGSTDFAPGVAGAKSLHLEQAYVSLPKGTANYQNVTLAAWVYWNGGPKFQRVFDFGSDIEANMWLSPAAGTGKLRFEITTTRGADGTGALDGVEPFPTGKWTHVAVTLDGAAGTLYVDGALVATAPITLAPLFAQPNCFIGKSQYVHDPLFSGRIQDFRVYNYALSAKAIADLAHAQSNR